MYIGVFILILLIKKRGVMKIRDHLDIDEIHTDNPLKEVKSKLEKNGFSVVIMNDASKVRQLIEDNIPETLE